METEDLNSSRQLSEFKKRLLTTCCARTFVCFSDGSAMCADNSGFLSMLSTVAIPLVDTR